MRRCLVPGGAGACLALVVSACSESGTIVGGQKASTATPDASDGADAGTFDATNDGAADGRADAPDASGRDVGSSDALPDGPPATLVSLTVSTGALVPAFDSNVIDYTMTSLNALYPIEVVATSSDLAAPLVVHGMAAKSGVPTSFQLSAGEDFTVQLPARTYTVHYVPKDLPGYTVWSAQGAGPEDVIVNAGLTYVLRMNRSGAPLYYRTFQPQITENFQQFTLPSGEIMYSTEVGQFDPGGWVLGSAHVMDSQFRDVADLQLLATATHATLPADGHDFLLLDRDHYVAMSYVKRTVDLSGLNPAWSSQATVVSAVVQEVVGGSVVFEWDSANVPSLYSDALINNTFQAGVIEDYLHLNSMWIDPADGNFVFSFRHTDSIVKVDRHTAQILWTLGGKEDQFGLTSDQVFSFQHYVRVEPDGSLWVFDNGNFKHQTRVISFVLDQVNKKVVSFSDIYDKPATQPPTAFMGSYAHLDPTRYLFGWGGWTTSDDPPSVTELLAGSVTWSLTFADPSVYSYRALPIPPL
jgi:hypothetical protein